MLFLSQRFAFPPVTMFARLSGGILIALSCQQLALITWQLFTPPSMPPQNQQPLSLSVAAFPLEPLTQLALFGQPTGEITPVQPPPPVKLPLRLTGIVASGDPQSSLAIIEHGKKQGSYSVGEQISSTQARIIAIYPDYVLVDLQGVQGTLQYEGAVLPQPSTTILPSQLQRQPQQIFDYLTISPVQQQGKLLGYRLNPGKKPELFSEIGLQNNDLAVALNGVDLRDPQQVQQVMQQLSELRSLTLTVERAGQRYDIAISLAEDTP